MNFGAGNIVQPFVPFIIGARISYISKGIIIVIACLKLSPSYVTGAASNCKTVGLGGHVLLPFL